MNKENMVYIYHEHYSVMKKNEIISFAGKWMEMEIIMLNELSQAQKAKYHMFLLICETYTYQWGGGVSWRKEERY
jgi:hypothetical protein